MKPVKATNINKNVNEFFYFKAIQKINQTRIENGDSPITMKQARGFRQSVINTLREKPAVKSYIDLINGKSSIGDTVPDSYLFGLMATPKYTKDDIGNAMRTKELVSSINEVLPEANMTIDDYVHVSNSLYDAYEDKKNGVHLTPISPYDNFIASREASFDNPGMLLFADLSSIPDSDVRDVGAVFEPSHELPASFYSQRTGDWNTTDGYIRPSRNSVYSREDYYGLSALRPYMTTDDYSRVKNTFVNAFSESGQRLSNENLKKAEDLLRNFCEKGYTYRMTCKQNGELVASFEGIHSGVDTTIIPGAKHAFDSNFGKVYTKGTVYRFTTNKKTPELDIKGNKVLDESGKTKMRTSVYVPSVEDVVSLTDFAFGEPIKRKDLPDFLVGKPHVTVAKFNNKPSAAFNDAYAGKSNKGNMAYKYADYDKTSNVYISIDARDVYPRTMFFGGKSADMNGNIVDLSPKDSADAYLREAVLTARDNYEKNLNVEAMILAAETNRDDKNYVFDFSKDEDIAKRQQEYWTALCLSSNEELHLPIVGMEVEEFDDEHPEISYYEGSNEEKVRQHASDLLEAEVGSFDADMNGKRFNPIGVSTYMDSVSSVVRNNDNIVVAMQLLDIQAEELKGSDYYNGIIRNRLIRFQEDSAKPIMHHGSEFMRNMGIEIKTALETSGCVVNDDNINVDSNGIIRYEASKVVGFKTNDLKHLIPETEPFHGYIGQIFVPDGHGAVTTGFGNGDNYMFVPGYTASVLPQKIGENLSFEERTRLKGYEQHMRETVRTQVREDMIVLFANYDGAPRGTTSSLNRTYRRLYDVRHPVDYLERTAAEGMSSDFYDAVLSTEARRVRYDTKFKEGATLNASYQASQRPDSLVNDMDNNPLTLANGRNLAVMSEESDGYFDKDATSTGMNQGITRYLVEGAVVNPDGIMIKSNDADDKTPLCKHKVMAWSDYVPFDRRQMVFNNAIKAQCITEKVKTAQMTFGGWTFDDGFVVTKSFAERYKVRGTNDELRSIIVGDKILDKNGNKGVISLVLDTDMSDEDAAEKGLTEAVLWARANPDVSVYGAPYPAVSRFNGGTARELMESPSALTNPHNNASLLGCVGEAEFIITHMTVDEKTHVYDDEDFQAGKGRRASAQLAWALNSKNAKAILHEFYDSNDKAFTNMREYMILCGFDMDETGKVMKGYTPHEGEVRNVFQMPSPQYKTRMKTDGSQSVLLDTKEQTNAFRKQINKQGGFLELPFQLMYPNGDRMPVLQEESEEHEETLEHTVVYNKTTWSVVKNGKEYMARRNAELLEKGNTMRTKSKEGAKDATYAMPVISSYLRIGQEYEDGTVSVHDYTLSYANVYKKATEYLDAKARGDVTMMSKCKADAQRSFDSVATDILERKFNSKYNAFKEEMMSNRLRDSATAVWTADPRLDIDQLAISKEMATSLNIQEGEHVMTWRDPVLRDAGVRYMRVKIDDTLTGVAINPVMDKSYDGDFDGDSIAVVKLHEATSKQEAMNQFSVAANLLDYGAKNEDGTYDLMLNHSLDLKTAEFCRPEMKARFADLTKTVNNFERAFREKTITSDALWVHRTDMVISLNKYVRDAFDHGFGESVVSYKDMSSHIKSVEEIVLSGAKGSYAKLADYGRYLGAKWERGEVTDINPEPAILLDTVEDLNVPQTGRKDSLAVQYATSVKSSVGVAGKFSQRGMKAMRNVSPKAVLEMTYPVTQALLQAKHDPIDARQKYSILMSATRDLWKGYKLEQQSSPVFDENGHKVHNADGTIKTGRVYVKKQALDGGKRVFDGGKAVYEVAKKEEWIAQMKDIYLSKDMMNVPINPEYIENLAGHLTDEKGFIRNIEDDNVGSPMDRIAYKSAGTDSLVLLADMALNSEGIYDGEFNQDFMPKSVRRNVQTLQHNTTMSDVLNLKRLKALAKSDTKSINKEVKTPLSDDAYRAKRRVVEKVAVTAETPFSELGDN